MAEDPVLAETEPGAGTAANEMEPETSMPMGEAGSGTDSTPAGDEANGATPQAKNKAPFVDETQWVDSPIWPPNAGRRRAVSEVRGGDKPILNEYGYLSRDEDGNIMFEPPGWRVQCDQFGRVCSDGEGQLCLE